MIFKHEKIEYVIQIFLRYWYQHSYINARKLSFCNVIFPLFDFTGQIDEYKKVSWWLNNLNIWTMTANSSQDWDYYCIYMMIIHQFWEMLSQFSETGVGFLARSWFALFYSIKKISESLPSNIPYFAIPIHQPNRLILSDAYINLFWMHNWGLELMKHILYFPHQGNEKNTPDKFTHDKWQN